VRSRDDTQDAVGGDGAVASIAPPGRYRPAGWVYAFVAALLVTLFLLELVLLKQRRAAARETARQQLTAVADLKADRLARWRRERIVDASLVTGTPGALQMARKTLQPCKLSGRARQDRRHRLPRSAGHRGYQGGTGNRLGPVGQGRHLRSVRSVAGRGHPDVRRNGPTRPRRRAGPHCAVAPGHRTAAAAPPPMP
jgi:hypothetical protein